MHTCPPSPAFVPCSAPQLPEGVQSLSDMHGLELTPEQRQQQLSRQASQQEALLRQVSRSSSQGGLRPHSQLDPHAAAEPDLQASPLPSPL